MTRSYAGYRAHELRHGVVHASPDSLVVLLGPLRTEPGSVTDLTLEFPAAFTVDPTVDVRFVELDRIPRFIAECRDGELAFPPRIDDYPAVPLDPDRAELDVELTGDRPGRMPEQWEHVPGFVEGSTEARLRRLSMTFPAEAGEGAHLVRVDHQDGTGVERGFSVVIYSREATRFPEDHDDDLSDLLHRAINLSRKNGVLWFVHPIYFVEQHLGVTLAPDVIEEMVTCEGLPPDLPASDDVIVPLQWGRGHHGLRKIRLDVDPLDEPDPCVDQSSLQKRPETGLTADFLSQASL